MALITIKECMNCGMDHEWEFDGPTLKELRTIKKLTGMIGSEFADAAGGSDPDAIAALVYVLHLRDKIKVPFDDIDLDFTKFDMAETEAEKKEREAMEKAAAAEEESKKSRPRSGRTRKAD